MPSVRAALADLDARGPPLIRALGGVVNSTRTLVIGGSVVGALAGGWFLMSHFLMDTAVGDAINESLGVAFGLLVLLSAIGAVRSGRDRPGRGTHP